FAALLHDGDYLGARVTLTLLASSSEYLAGRPAVVQQHSRRIAVLADPVFGSLAQARLLAGDGEVFRNWSNTLAPLPATAREAAALEQLYPEAERLILTGAAASAHNFFSEEVRHARIIHIATHGYFNEQLPEL